MLNEDHLYISMSYVVFEQKCILFDKLRYIIFHEKENVSYSPQDWEFLIQNCYAFRVCELLEASELSPGH